MRLPIFGLAFLAVVLVGIWLTYRYATQGNRMVSKRKLQAELILVRQQLKYANGTLDNIEKLATTFDRSTDNAVLSDSVIQALTDHNSAEARRNKAFEQ